MVEPALLPDRQGVPAKAGAPRRSAAVGPGPHPLAVPQAAHIAQLPADAKAAEPPEQRLALVGVLLALSAPLLVVTAHGVLDQPNPDTTWATILYGLAVALTPMAIFGAIARLRKRGLGFLGAGAALASFLVVPVVEVGSRYAPSWGNVFPEFSLLAAYVAVLCAGAAVLAGHFVAGRQGRWAGFLAVEFGWVLGWSIAAGYFLFTMDHQVEVAREAWSRPTPGDGIVMGLGALVVAAYARRRHERRLP